jgi:hypothetical protein
VLLDPARPGPVVLRGQGPFRVLDRKGQVVADAATGAWQAVPGPKGGIRVVPPQGQGPKPPAARKPPRRFPYRAVVAAPDRRAARASSI